MFALANTLAAAGFASSPIAKMLAELRKFGANGHLYLPGLGIISGVVAGNYLDSLGTTNAIADGNVGLLLDGAGSVGTELIVSQDISSSWIAEGPTPPVAANGADQFLGSACRSVTFPVIASGGYAVSRAVDYANNFAIAAGNSYACSLEYALSRPLTGSEAIVIAITGSSSLLSKILTSATPAGVFIQQSSVGACVANALVSPRPFASTLNSPVTVYIRRVTVKQVTGIHATQATTGYQPVLRRGITNLFTYSSDANGTGWQRTGCVVSANKVVADTSTGYHLAHKSYLAASGVVNTTAFLLRSAEYTKARVSDASNQTFYLTVDLLTGAISAAGGTSYVSSSSVVLPNGNVLVTLTLVGTGVARVFGAVGFPDSGATITGFGAQYTGDGVSGIYVYNSGIFVGTLTAQQIIALGGIPLTTTAAASSSAGAYKLDFDGVDDYLSLGSIAFQMADDHYTAIALTPTAVNTGKHVLNPANGAASQQVGNISVDSNSKYITRWCDDATNVLGVADTVTVTQGVASVLASRRAGTTGVLRKNGAQVGAISLASLGATTLTLPGVIGAYKTGASPSAMSLHGTVVIKGTVTDAQALIFERGLNAAAQYAAGRF